MQADDISAVFSAIFAGISAVAAFVTIWWPWHTRGRASIKHRDKLPKNFPEMLPHLILPCGCRRPSLFVQWRNDGDATAHAVRVSSDVCDVILMVEGEQYRHGFDIISDVALLKPGEKFTSILLPRVETDREHVDVTLEYLEEPTRLKKSLVSTPISLPYRLRGLRPLGDPEKHAAWGDLRDASEQMGYGSTSVEVLYFVQRVCPEYLDRLGLPDFDGSHQPN